MILINSHTHSPYLSLFASLIGQWYFTNTWFSLFPSEGERQNTICFYLGKLIETVGVPWGILMYQYIDDILAGGGNKEQVDQVAKAIWNLLTWNRGLQNLLPVAVYFKWGAKRASQTFVVFFHR